jgi:hypothetical protein
MGIALDDDQCVLGQILAGNEPGRLGTRRNAADADADAESLTLPDRVTGSGPLAPATSPASAPRCWSSASPIAAQPELDGK